jgi:hypothetical protein
MIKTFLVRRRKEVCNLKQERDQAVLDARKIIIMHRRVMDEIQSKIKIQKESHEIRGSLYN